MYSSPSPTARESAIRAIKVFEGFSKLRITPMRMTTKYSQPATQFQSLYVSVIS